MMANIAYAVVNLKHTESKSQAKTKTKLPAIEGHSTKLFQQIRVKDWLIEEECGSWRRSPSKVTPQKFPTDTRQRLIEEEYGSWR